LCPDFYDTVQKYKNTPLGRHQFWLRHESIWMKLWTMWTGVSMWTGYYCSDNIHTCGSNPPYSLESLLQFGETTLVFLIWAWKCPLQISHSIYRDITLRTIFFSIWFSNCAIILASFLCRHHIQKYRGMQWKMSSITWGVCGYR